MQLPISILNSYLSPFPSYCTLLVKFELSTGVHVPLFDTFVPGESINSGPQNLTSGN